MILGSAARVVVERRVAGGSVTMANRTKDAALSRVGISVLRLQSGESKSGTVVRSRIEVGVYNRGLTMSSRIDFDIAQWNIVQVVRRHVTARTESVQKRARARHGVFSRANVEV